MYSIVFFVIGLTLNVQAQTRCADITQVAVDFTVLQQYSPWDVMVSSDPNYNCTTAILTGPAPTNGNNFTWVMIQKDKIKNVANVGLFQNKQNVRLTTCSGGASYDYRFLYFSKDYFITYVCEFSGDSILMLRGYGHNTTTDLAAIKSIMDKPENQFKYTGDATVTDVEAQCTLSKICSGFYM